MEVTLSSRQMDELAYKTAVVLAKLLKKQEQPELVSTSEAASLLKITPQRLRQIVCETPNRYPHIKRGECKQARLLFDRKSLTA